MIYTCTLNPSLDYFLNFPEKLKRGGDNRSTGEHYAAGGKGINISIVLSNMGIPSRALGFLGGFSKDLYISLLADYVMLQPNFTYIEGNTRINVKVQDGINTTLNALGPHVSEENMNSLCRKIDKLAEGDYLAVAGYCQNYLVDRVCEMLIEAIDEGVRTVLYTNSKILHTVMPHKPFLVKTTVPELEIYYGKTIETDEEAMEAACKMHEEGAKHVLLVLPNYTKAVLICDEGVFVGDIKREDELKNTVGIGDSLVAGYLMHFNRSSDEGESFRYALGAASATAYSDSFGSKEACAAYYERSEYQKIK